MNDENMKNSYFSRRACLFLRKHAWVYHLENAFCVLKLRMRDKMHFEDRREIQKIIDFFFVAQ